MKRPSLPSGHLVANVTIKKDRFFQTRFMRNQKQKISFEKFLNYLIKLILFRFGNVYTKISQKIYKNNVLQKVCPSLGMVWWIR